MFSAAKSHILVQLMNARVRPDPFPHVLVENIFPTDLYAEMQARKLPDASYKRLLDTGRVSERYSPQRLCFMPPEPDTAGLSKDEQFWTDLMTALNDGEFLQAWLQVFSASLLPLETEFRKRYDLPAGVPVGISPEMFLMRDKENYDLGPHTDTPKKLISALFYLPADDRTVMLGTSLYRPRQVDYVSEGGSHMPREHFEMVGTLPFRPNTVFAFPNMRGSYHGVEPVSGQGLTRDLLLYDIKFTSAAQ